jgi:hypothetical protein
MTSPRATSLRIALTLASLAIRVGSARLSKALAAARGAIPLGSPESAQVAL